MNTFKLFGIASITILTIIIFFFHRKRALKVLKNVYRKTILVFNPNTYISQLSIVILGIFLALQADQIYHKKNNHKNVIKQFKVMDAEINNNFLALQGDKERLNDTKVRFDTILMKYEKLFNGKDYFLQNEYQSLHAEVIDAFQSHGYILLSYQTYDSFNSLLNDDRFDLIDDIDYRIQLSSYLNLIRIYNNKLEKVTEKISFRFPGTETITGKKRAFGWEEVEGIYLVLIRFSNEINMLIQDNKRMISITIDFNKELKKYKDKINNYR